MGAARVEVVGFSRPQKIGQLRELVTDILVINYTTGGDTITPADLGFNKILFAVCERNVSGTVATYDKTNNKVKSFTSAGAESAAASADTFRFRFTGI